MRDVLDAAAEAAGLSVPADSYGAQLAVEHAAATAERARALAAAVRTRRPLVHCLTNAVTTQRVADALAAVGALPVMASAPEEVADMMSHAQALVLNLGTPTAERWAAARAAGVRARELGVPIVVDPVGCGATPWRTAQARQLLDAVGATVVRGNIPEVAALMGSPPPAHVAQRGVTAEHHAPRSTGAEDEAAASLAREAARRLGCVVVMTGPTDFLSDGVCVRGHAAGVPALAGLVGAGDVLDAVIAASLAAEPQPSSAGWTAWAGLWWFAGAARLAASTSRGPGTYWPNLMDALAEAAPEAGRDAFGGAPTATTQRLDDEKAQRMKRGETG